MTFKYLPMAVSMIPLEANSNDKLNIYVNIVQSLFQSELCIFLTLLYICVLSRPLLLESADGSESLLSFPPPPDEDTLLPALPAHLFCDSTEFPTPPPTPPESAPLDPEPESAPPVSPSDSDQVPNAAVVPLPQLQHDQQPSPPARYVAFPFILQQ